MRAAWTERIAKWAPPIASALLLLLAFPPFNLWFCAFFALVPWLYGLSKEDMRYSARSGFLFGFVTALGQLYFMFAMTLNWTKNFPLSLIPYLISCAIVASFHAVLGRLIWRAMQADKYWLIPLIWAGIEVLRSYIPGLAFPWGLLGTPFYKHAVISNIAYFGTIYLVSAYAAMTNVAVLYFTQRKARLGYSWIGVHIGFLILGFARAAIPQQGADTTLTAGQPGVNMAFTPQDDLDREMAMTVPELAQQAKAQQSKLLILPEGLVIGGDGIPPETSFMVPQDIPVLFGGKRGNKVTHQTAFAYDGKWSFADKTRLVPFGEYVPGRNTFPGIAKAFKLPSGDISPGEKVTPLDVAGIRIGALICFEGLFHDVAQAQADEGSQLLAAMCVDDWYFGTPAPEQLMSASVFRAIETGLPLVRVGGLGYTQAVDQRGKIIAQAPLTKASALTFKLKIPEKTTRFPFVRVFPWIAVLTTVGWWGFGLLRRRNRADTPAEEEEADHSSQAVSE